MNSRTAAGVGGLALVGGLAAFFALSGPLPRPVVVPRGCRDRSCVRERYIPTPPPYFEFAPTSGVGMGTVCACSADITGSKGEIVTFTRASSAYCTKSNEWSSIANGDMVQCTSNQPLVMPGGTGTGPLGALVEDSTTNLVLRSQEFDNASWANFTAGTGVNPTKSSADIDTAPDNSVTAERVTFATTMADAGDSSGLSQAGAMADAGAFSVYARDTQTTDGGVGGGTFDIAVDQASGVQCGTCTYVVGSWTRCAVEKVPMKSGGNVYLGNLASLCGTIRAAQTVTLWGAQLEMGDIGRGITTSYVPSSSSVGTRAKATLAIPIQIPASPFVSFAASKIVGPGAVATGQRYAAVNADPASTATQTVLNWASLAGLAAPNIKISNTSHQVFPPGTETQGINRISVSYDGVSVIGCMASCVSSPFTFAPYSGTATVLVGSIDNVVAVNHADRVIKQVCFDISANGCQ